MTNFKLEMPFVNVNNVNNVNNFIRLKGCKFKFKNIIFNCNLNL